MKILASLVLLFFTLASCKTGGGALTSTNLKANNQQNNETSTNQTNNSGASPSTITKEECRQIKAKTEGRRQMLATASSEEQRQEILREIQDLENTTKACPD